MTSQEVTHASLREFAERSRLLLTVPEAAEALGLSRTKLYELIMRRSVRSVRIDGLRRIPVEALEAYVADLLAAEEEPGYGAGA